MSTDDPSAWTGGPERGQARLLGKEASLLRTGGGAPGLLLLHGVPTGAEIWRPVIEQLSGAGLRCIAPDLPGFGQSQPPRNPSILAYHSFITEMAQREGLGEDFVLVGHDLGGLYALTWALANPGRLRALVLLNTTIYPDAGVALGLVPLLAPGFGEAYASLAGRPRYRPLIQRDLRSIYPEGATTEILDRLTAPYERTASWLALVRALRGLSPARVLRWKRRMGSLDLRVLILWGEGDPYFPASVPERLHRDLPDSRLVSVPGGGHFPMLSRPELVAEEIARFVER